MTEQESAVCHMCDWVSRVPELAASEWAYCPRCEGVLQHRRVDDLQAPLAWSAAGLLALLVALLFQFIWFQTQGVSNGMWLLDAVFAMAADGYPLLAGLVALTIIVLPAFYLAGMFYMALALACGRRLPGARLTAMALGPVRPWLMGDVFIVGVLVSLIKIVTMAEIALGPAFFAFAVYALLLLRAMTLVPTHRFWARFGAVAQPPVELIPGRSAAGQGVAECRGCGLPFAFSSSACPRCGLRQSRLAHDHVQWTVALLATATMLLIPANTLPILQTASLGYDAPATIIGGVRELIETGSWPIAAIIFVASIVVPIGKILILGWLCRSVSRPRSGAYRLRLRLYRITEFVGRWSMIDIFVVAVLTALIQAGALMSVHPGPAALAFAAVVILTMLAAITFDPREIWRRADTARARAV